MSDDFAGTAYRHAQWKFSAYKRDKDLDSAHTRGDHAEALVFGCHHCTELVKEYETRLFEEQSAYAEPDYDGDAFDHEI